MALPALRFMSLLVGLRLRPACKCLVLDGGVEFCLESLQRFRTSLPIITSALRLLVLAARVDGDEATGGPHPFHGVAKRVCAARLAPWADEERAAAAYAAGAKVPLPPPLRRPCSPMAPPREPLTP